MEKIENEKIYKIILAIFTTISISIVTLFCFFCIGLSKVEAASYYFDYPRINTICNNDRLGICTEASGNGISSSDSKYVGSPNGNAVGNYVNVIYRYDQNINNISGSSYIAGNYSVSLKYQIYTVEGTEIDKNKIKVRLIYYPDNSNQYAYATCDNNENITITNAFEDSDMFNITYTCETLQITDGKSFLGFNIKIDNSDDPFGLTKYIKFGQVITNMTLIGEGEATNNDIINNQNQNTQQIIDAINGGKLEDTTPINPDKQKELEEIEGELLKEDIITSLNDIDISIDKNSNEFIWNLVTKIINTNSLIFGLVLTMLSLGILKLVLNR